MIVEDLTSKAYADRIIEIVNGKKVLQYSKKVFDHFQTNYTQKVVFERTLRVYEKIL